MSLTTNPSLFQKGNKLSSGRPRGAMNKTTENRARLKELASAKYEEAFSMLWEAMESKEGWAYNLYFKELVPKGVYRPTILVEAGGNNAGERVSAIVRELPNFGELTHEEAIDELRALNNIQATGNSEHDDSNVLEQFSDERVKQIISWSKEQKNSL